MRRPTLTKDLDLVAEVATIVLGLAVVTGLVVRWPKPVKLLQGTWEFRATEGDGTVTARRMTFVGPNEGWWWRSSGVGRDAPGADSLAFSVEGPRDNRFCVRLPPTASACMVLIAFPDSLVVDSTASTATGSGHSTRWVFLPVR